MVKNLVIRTEMDPSQTSAWTPGRRFAFRFGAIYFVLYALLNGNVATLPVAWIAAHGQAPDWYSTSTNAVWAAIGHALGVRGEIVALDNGDSVGDHVALLCFLLVSLVGAVVWSVRDRARTEYRRGFDLLCIGVRYVLALTVFAYAIFKVFPTQFSLPSPSRLVQTYGASSRMGLLWTFMGTSPAYQMFAGWAELMGCMLLMSRRTTTLGALVLLAILTNVLLMDVCYDVPAKLCVIHLLGMAVFLLAPNAVRLVDVFARNRPVPAVDLGPAPSRGRIAAKIAFVASVLYFEGLPVARLYFTERDGSPLPALYGVYDVGEMRRAGEVVPPFIHDASYWRFIAVERRRVVAVMANGSRVQLPSSPGANGQLTAKRAGSALAIAPIDADQISVEGTYEDQPFSARARRLDEKREILVHQPMRWFYVAPDTR
jgi:hypothetical protein